MGKRKLHASGFFQCDWTGFPMKQVYCYMPSWSSSGKLLKKGSYCNWESVVAHAADALKQGTITNADLMKIYEHVQHITGTIPNPAPHFDELLHTKGRMDVNEFHKACTTQTDPVMGVKITPNGDIFELLLFPDQDGFNFAKYLHIPYSSACTPSSFHSMRKKGACKMTERDLGVWYYATKELQHNPTASNIFKMQLYGDVLMVQQSREASFMTRERFVTFNKQMFDDFFIKKRKRVAEPASMTPEAYAVAKEEMQRALNRYEQKVSEKAQPVQDTQMVQMRAPSVSLAKKLKERTAEVASQPLPPPELVAARS